IPDDALGTGSATVSTFLRGDRSWNNTLVGPLGAFTIPADTSALLTVGQTANAAIKVVGGSTSQPSFPSATHGSSNPWDMQLVYDPQLSEWGWQDYGGPIRGVFSASGLNVTGTVTAGLFTGSADASLITSGVFNVARLGSGSGNANTFLNGAGVFTIPA